MATPDTQTASSKPSATPTINGTCDERFEAVKTAFEANFASGEEIGASVAVTVDGVNVVDLWAGEKSGDESHEAGPWQEDTIVNVWSTTKTMAATCMLMLADQGKLDFNAPVAQYWPEFAAQGKEDILVRHVMGHTSGLAGWAEPIEVADLFDWEKATSLLAAQAPLWEDRTQSGYHAITLGYLQGEIFRRITGETIGSYFAANVAGPLGADFHIGLPESEDHRVGALLPPGAGLGGPDMPAFTREVLGNPSVSGLEPRLADWRRAEIPAAGGHGNARSVARIHSALACGGSVDGVTLLSEAGLEPIFEVQAEGIDKVLGRDLRLGMGFGLSSPTLPLPSERAFYWGGWGGSVAVIDLDQRMSVSYVMNRMYPSLDGDLRSANLLMAAYGVVLS